MSPVLRSPAMLLFLLGCSDYKLAGEGDDLGGLRRIGVGFSREEKVKLTTDLLIVD